MSAMLTLEEAQARLLELVPDQPLVETPTDEASSLYLALDLAALRTQPTSDLSAMDGYAICGDGPWQRVGESRAGAPFVGALNRGECTRISTGAHMPSGSNRVLIQENANVHGTLVDLAEGATLPDDYRHVRNAGFDFAKGQIVLSKGTRMGAAQIALALASGHDCISHRVAPRVAVLDSGDELARTSAECSPNQIPASNGAMIAAMLSPYVDPVVRLGPVPDNREALANALGKAECDILITTGGASVGDHDLMQDALKDWGADITFWKVAIKPGKPLMVAVRDVEARRQVILGLPGNPVSSFVTAQLFALPLIRASLGDLSPMPRRILCQSDQDLPATGKRREFIRAVFDGHCVKCVHSQDSSGLLALAEANCLIDRPAGAPPVTSGEPVPMIHLQNG